MESSEDDVFATAFKNMDALKKTPEGKRHEDLMIDLAETNRLLRSINSHLKWIAIGVGALVVVAIKLTW